MQSNETFEKNGKPWEKVWKPCGKCDGLGIIPYYNHVYNGTCFLCNGYRGKWIERRVLTEKEMLKREKSKQRRQEKRELELTQKKENRTESDRIKLGLTGTLYVVALENTFSIRQEIQNHGGKFHPHIGWYFTEPTDIYPVMEIPDSQVFVPDEWGVLVASRSVKVWIESLVKQKIGDSSSEHQGIIGEKITITVRLKRIISIDTKFGAKTLYIFQDADGNLFKWITSPADRGLSEEEEMFELTGTVKSHSEYEGQKQTELTRCKKL